MRVWCLCPEGKRERGQRRQRDKVREKEEERDQKCLIKHTHTHHTHTHTLGLLTVARLPLGLGVYTVDIRYIIYILQCCTGGGVKRVSDEKGERDKKLSTGDMGGAVL